MALYNVMTLYVYSRALVAYVVHAICSNVRMRTLSTFNEFEVMTNPAQPGF